MKLRRFICGIGLLAVILSIAAPAAAEEESQYMAVLLGSKKLGYAHNTRTVADGKATTGHHITITIARGAMSVTVTQKSQYVETTDGKPLSFSATQDLGIMSMSTSGKVRDGKIHAAVTGGGSTKNRTLDWPSNALMPEGARLLQKAKGLEKGTKYSYRLFQPDSLSASDVKVVVGPKEEVDLLGRVVKLTEVASTIAGPTDQITAKSYVKDDLTELKTVAPLLGMQLEIVACSKAYALSENDATTDIFDSLLLRSPQPLGNLEGVNSVTYTLKPSGGATAGRIGKALLATDNQSVKVSGDSVTVRVAPLRPAANAPLPYEGSDKTALDALKPTRYLQSDNKKIVSMAKEAIGDATDAATAAARIQQYVRKHVNKKDLSVGYATALEVAESRQGDCTEHAVLAAALCRSAGVPAQVVIGLAYVKEWDGQKDIFGPHAWYRAYVDGKWIGYDAALPGGYDAGHIALDHGDGDADAFFNAATTLGFFTIEKAEIEK